eukprot:765450-Hanusia_phi.AAC.2
MPIAQPKVSSMAWQAQAKSLHWWVTKTGMYLMPFCGRSGRSVGQPRDTLMIGFGKGEPFFHVCRWAA